MGFYGNITNISNTNFQFDRIYPNRVMMEASANGDGIFVGRHVLVEYDRNEAFPIIFTKSNKFYSDASYSQQIKFKQGKRLTGESQQQDAFYSGEIGQVQTTDNKGTKIFTFYQCTNLETDGSTYAKFEEITSVTSNNTYIQNFSIDEGVYGKTNGFKGYDSTVWTKVSETNKDGKLITKYVNIADLNSVVPTFDMTEDAPTMNALTPHFDADNTNVYYKLHMQSPYGFRVKAATNGTGSDLRTTHITAGYDKNNNMISKKKTEVDADIYYNVAGFDEAKSSFKEANTDVIKILPTGISGKTYSDYPNLPADMEMEQWGGDIQELSIRLPSIGNTISKVWDIIYDNSNGYGIDGGTRNRDIEWKYTNDTDKNGDNALGGMTRNLSTVAGCINSVHDLMGMIVYSGRPKLSTNPDNTLIYFDNGKYYRIGIQYNITAATEVLDGIEYFVDTDDQGIFAPGTKWNNEVKTIPQGVHLITRIEEPCWIEMDLGESLNTIHGWILQLSKYFCDDIDNLTRNRETVQGTINYLNDIIDKFDKLVPGEFVVVDEYGRMQSAGYTTQQAYSFTNYGQSIEGTGSDDDYPQSEDRWIAVDIDTNHENPFITITHNFTPVENDTTTTSDKNDPKEVNGGINNNTKDELYLYAPIVDSTGHVVGKNIESVTLPYGFKTIKIGKQATNTDVSNLAGHNSDTSVTADNTQDTLTILPANKWVCLHGTNDDNANSIGDVIRVGHQVNGITDTDKNDIDLNIVSTHDSMTDGNTIKIPDWEYDEAGHITAKQSRTYTLPFGYKTIVATNSSEVNVEPSDVKDTPTADNTQDTLNIKAANKWIKLNTTDSSDTDGNSISFAHTLVGTNFGKTYYSNVDNSNADDDHNRGLDFGSTFKIFNLTTDNAGHIININTNNITLPTIGLTNNNDGNMITGISYSYSDEDHKGTLTETRANVGTLKLTDYGVQQTEDNKDTNIVTSADSINTAFTKVENKLNTFLQDASVTEEAIDTLRELQDYISTHTSEATNMLTAINTIYTNNNGIESGRLIDEQERAEAAESEIVNMVTTLRAEVVAKNEEFVDSLNNNVATLQEQINNETSTRAQDVYTLNSRCNVLDKEVKTLINNTNEITPKIINLQDGLIEVDTEVASLIVNMENEIQTRAQEVYTLNSRCNVLDNEVKQLINKVAELTTKIEELSNNN